MLPMVFRQGVQPDHLAGQPLGFQQGPHSGLPVHGLGIGEDQKGCGIVQRRRFHFAQFCQRPAQVGTPAEYTGLPHILPEGIHILQAEGIRFPHFLGEKEASGAFRHIVHGQNEAQYKLGKLHHRATHIAQKHQMALVLALFLVFEFIETAAGLQTFADGTAEIQGSAVTPVFALIGQFRIDLLGDFLNHRNRLGDLLVLKLGDVPEQQAHIRIHVRTADARILQSQLLLQNGLGKDGVDEIAVKLRIALGIIPEAIHEISQFFLVFLREHGIGFPLIVGKLHGTAVQLQFLHGLLPCLLQLHLLLRSAGGLGFHGLLREKKAVKGTVIDPLFLPGFGKHRAQGGFHQGPVLKPQIYEDFTGICRLLWADRKTFQPQHPGKSRQLFQVDGRLNHGGVLRNDRRSCRAGREPPPAPALPDPPGFSAGIRRSAAGRRGSAPGSPGHPGQLPNPRSPRWRVSSGSPRCF